MEGLLNRVLPHNLEAERGIIRSILIDSEKISKVMDILIKDDFYSKHYGIYYDHILTLNSENTTIDIVTLSERLKRSDVPEEISAPEAIASLYEYDYNVISNDIEEYARIVYQNSVLRKLIRVNEEIANLCYLGKQSFEEIIEKTEKDIFKILEKRGRTELVPIKEVAENVLDKIVEASMSNKSVTGVATGFIDLDSMTSGFQPSDLVLIAARPSMGKTAFVLNIIQHISVKKKQPCMIFSLEMSKEQLVNRMFSMESSVDAQKLRRGDLNDSDWIELLRGVVEVSESNLVIDDTPGISLNELRSKCRKMKLEQGLSIVVIDYIQLMTGSSRKSENRQQEISDISRGLKAIAREIKAPVVALSQLSRACETREDHRPMLSDLRESGAIEQDADIVMFLYRDDYYNKGTRHPGEAEVIIAKQRNGPIGTVKLVWKSDTTRFCNMAKK
jgi:replicative DNA helicase